ncbi:hypothetical protein A2165_00100 [Candidatus Curtissbacteria bacterium RBG_13_40_7]|uniref:Endonuclease/exonuclease/phosphatase domain-containing protein n=1 Tax=Candidatus Curtissbacteria bacterium RBG_13_40_7 TaxID=1797706 RepID=A0A1F5FXK2_9BACT|nr:MAG: hypothetical protein A2165_00100 [Candidatus Curtissbacteria bacterium RBG_13_40_7]
MPQVIKFIQINIYKGKWLDDLLDYLLRESPDFVSVQEITSGCTNYYNDKNADLFEIIKSKLNYDGIFHIDFEVLEPKGTFGNGVFSRHKIIDKTVLTLKDPRVLTIEETEDDSVFASLPRHMLDARCNFNGKTIHAMSWHGTWTAPPHDTDVTLKQAQMVADYLKSLKEPFILGGDLNAVPQSKTVGLFNKVTNNLMMGSGILETTNLKVHKIAPRGFLVDYIFTSNHFRLKRLTVPRVTVSDHLPVVAELELIDK